MQRAQNFDLFQSTAPAPEPVMEDEGKILLSPQEAVAAVCMDFRQYRPQSGLFRKVSPVILQSAAQIRDDPVKGGIWMRPAGGRKEQFFSGRQLGELLCKALASETYLLETLARICSMVFWTRACAHNGDSGIWVQTGMEAFNCRRCGQCCSLQFRDQCVEEDHQRWLDLGRTDIIDWVGFVDSGGRPVARHLWMHPGTNQYAKVCPWLKQISGSGGCACLIHEVKPWICRQYPGSRKHAVMTGCPAFTTP